MFSTMGHGHPSSAPPGVWGCETPKAPKGRDLCPPKCALTTALRASLAQCFWKTRHPMYLFGSAWISGQKKAMWQEGLDIYIYIYLSIYLFICLFIHLYWFIYLYIYLVSYIFKRKYICIWKVECIYLFIYFFVYLFVCLLLLIYLYLSQVIYHMRVCVCAREDMYHQVLHALCWLLLLCCHCATCRCLSQPF